MKVLTVNTLHITLWCQTCEFVSIWCAVHPCGGHSGKLNIVKAPDHLSNLQQNAPSKESAVSFLALGQISFRSSVLKHFNPLTRMSLMSDKRQTVKTLQSTKCRRLRMAVKNIYCRIHFHCVHVQVSLNFWPQWLVLVLIPQCNECICTMFVYSLSICPPPLLLLWRSVGAPPPP